MPRGPLVIRPIEPDDKAGLTAAFARLSDESRYRRFLSPHDHLSTVELGVDLPPQGLGPALAAWLRSSARGALRLPDDT